MAFVNHSSALFSSFGTGVPVKAPIAQKRMRCRFVQSRRARVVMERMGGDIGSKGEEKDASKLNIGENAGDAAKIAGNGAVSSSSSDFTGYGNGVAGNAPGNIGSGISGNGVGKNGVSDISSNGTIFEASSGDINAMLSEDSDVVGEDTVISETTATVQSSAKSSGSEGMIRPSAEKGALAEECVKDSPPDLVRIGGVGVVVAVIAALLQHSWIQDHRDTAMLGIFILGYLGIVLEEMLGFDKTGVALLMGVGVWTVLMTDSGGGEAGHHVKELLSEQVADISQILFFLIGAMTIVEIVDAHRGFKVVTDFITTNNRRILLWTIGILTFFVSAVLDNLTSTIVIVSLLRKLVADPKERWLFGAAVVVAANAGGAWTPIGDVTTTQLWVHGNISALKTMTDLFLPSIVSLLTTLACFTPLIGEGEFERPKGGTGDLAPRAPLIFWTGLAALVSVPVFKAVTGLPPYLGMLSGLGTLWIMTDALHVGENRESLRGLAAVKRIDTSGVLFFLGILLAVGGLESAGILGQLAHFLDSHVPSRELIAAAIGLLSSIVDNVPLVAATMGMYSLDRIPQDAALWQLIAFCAGTGGSILIIGSAAGVAFMGMERVDFGWYARKVSLPTLAGFAAGIATYVGLHAAHIPHFTSALGM